MANINTRDTHADRSNSQSAKGADKSVGELAGGYADSLVSAIRSRPLTAAVIAAGAAGAGALLWTKRAAIGEQAGVAGEKLGALRDVAGEKLGVLRDQASEQVEALRGKINERLAPGGTSGDSSSIPPIGSIPDGALTELDPTVAEQSKVGAVAY